jgi:hypothetical protein
VSVHVSIGPVPSASALAYIDLARFRIDELLKEDGELEGVLTPFVVDMFRGYLDEWEQAARSGDPMRWETDVDPELVEHVFHAFFLCVRYVNAVHDDEPEDQIALRTPFRVALTNGVLDALEGEGKSAAELARALREAWPEDDLS